MRKLQVNLLYCSLQQWQRENVEGLGVPETQYLNYTLLYMEKSWLELEANQA